MIYLSNSAGLLLFCDCLVLLWILILTEPEEAEDPDRNTTGWN